MALTTAQRVDALLKKTTTNGCTQGEQAAAVEKAKELVAKYKLRSADFVWPPEPKVEQAPKAPPTPKAPAKPKAASPTPKSGEMQPAYAKLAALLRGTKGLTIAELREEMGGIEPHSVRAMISILRGKHGLVIETQHQKGGALYRIVTPA